MNSSAGNFGDARDETIAHVRITVLCFCLLFTLGGNLFVFLLVTRNRPKSVHQLHIYHFMVHLSLADMLVGVFNILPQIVWEIYFRFRWGNIACKFVKFMQIFVLYLSTYTLVGLSLNSSLVVRSGSSSTSSRLWVILGAGWFLSALLASPQVYIFSFKQLSNGVYDCWGTFDPPLTSVRYVVYFIAMALIVPALIMGACYSYLCRASSKRLMSDAKLKTIRMTMVMVLVFVLCWTPFCCAQLYLVFGGEEASTFVTMCLMVPNLNSCANPWVYLSFSTDLRRRLVNFCSLIHLRGNRYGEESRKPCTRANAIVCEKPARQLRGYRIS
ncbi:oxytocin receptor-like [Galendromus occidentalis]|uniref:Oxytocin receptor-like n=1 Tax=Galendromus occidentalis TaxID=34638 RepID=A0AAJ6VYB5_9ACAR|nr:oxytocin receptor-like [Galendromus occidentalis]